MYNAGILASFATWPTKKRATPPRNAGKTGDSVPCRKRFSLRHPATCCVIMRHLGTRLTADMGIALREKAQIGLITSSHSSHSSHFPATWKKQMKKKKRKSTGNDWK
jgi:hypothetical protein